MTNPIPISSKTHATKRWNPTKTFEFTTNNTLILWLMTLDIVGQG
ncbi:hypothetical protein [Desulfonatronovibrio magnus]|nr:hypothetical protein [Desulfonatronovibrio magnus]